MGLVTYGNSDARIEGDIFAALSKLTIIVGTRPYFVRYRPGGAMGLERQGELGRRYDRFLCDWEDNLLLHFALNLWEELRKYLRGGAV